MRRHAKAMSAGTNVLRKRHGRHRSLNRCSAAWALGLIVATMALAAPSLASAFVAHPFVGQVGSASQPSFERPWDLAVDQASGDLLVFDAGNADVGPTISRFKPDGTPDNFSALGTNVIDGSETPQGALSLPVGAFGSEKVQITVDNSAGITGGNIYVTQARDNLIDVFAKDGSYLGQLTASSEGPLGTICGVAVDSTGAVYVGDFDAGIHKYEPDANPPVNADNSANFPHPRACNLALGAGPTAGAIFTNLEDFSISKINGETGEVEYVVNPGRHAKVAVNPADGHVYTSSESIVQEYDASGTSAATLLSTISSENIGPVGGLAVDKTTGRVYIARYGNPKIEVWGPATLLPDATTEPATAVGADRATLHGTISAAGGPEASCDFQYITEESFEESGFAGATNVPCSPAGPFTGSTSDPVNAEIGGLRPGTVYFFRAVGTNEDGSNPAPASKAGALSFLTAGPSIVATTVTDVTSTSATVTGFVDPHGKPFTYHVDYGPTESYGFSIPVPDAGGGELPIGTGSIGSGAKIEGVVLSQGALAVGQDIVGAGIKPGTTVTAIEGSTLTLSDPPTAGGTVSFTSTTVFVSAPIGGLVPAAEYHARLVATSVDATFLGPDRRFATFPLGTGLPDGRAYEMVSPALKIGEAFPPEPLGLLGSSCPSVCQPGSTGVLMPMQATADGNAVAFEGQPFFAGLAPSANQYLARRSGGGWSTQSITPPLASNGNADSTSGFKGLSADLSRGVLFQRSALSDEVPPAEGTGSYNELYLWEAGNPNLRPLVTVKPPHRLPGAPLTPDVFELSFSGANSGTAAEPAFGHLVFEANDSLTPAVPDRAPAAPEVEAGRCGGLPGGDCNLYEWVDGQLRLVNVLPGNDVAATHAVVGSGRRLVDTSSSGGEPKNQSANVDHAISADGRRIFWSDESGRVYVRVDGEETVKIDDAGRFLTASPDGSKVLLDDGCIYSLAAEECEAQLSGTPAAFLGPRGASEDLSRVYFVSTEALAPGAQPGSCKSASSPAELEKEREGRIPAGLGCNVYAYDDGSVDFVATLSRRDNNFALDSVYGSWKSSPSNRTAQVTADGRYLAFMSYMRLGDYDNRAAQGGCEPNGPPACQEIYEYDLDTDTLSCASCNPSGQRPLGNSNLSLIKVSLGGSLPQPENLLADGRVFFESQDALSPGDVNGRILDVYEWKPGGIGGCERAVGCVALISSGHAPEDSMFLNATPSGNDAFLVTREQLLARDKDDQLDVYDARVGGGIAEVIVPSCAGEACRGAASIPPAAESPGTSTFSAPGNLKPPCKRGFVRKHVRCVKKHGRHKKHDKRSAKHKKSGGSK